ncbi:kynurenine formamidase [Nematostella vectensis]|uniref:kynurenine formamidase n=1 Tax=Nematostella vectensis TaxID=45351 RepID=UPI0020773F56|nr:kynurenine formamidase [Nematostella vectensis]
MEIAVDGEERPSYDKDIEYEYAPSNYIKLSEGVTPEEALDAYIQEWHKISKRAREELDVELNVPYAPTSDRTRIDFYRSKSEQLSENPPVYMYVHGGYWEMCSKEEHGLVSYPAVSAGAVSAVIDYDLLPTVTLDEIVAQTKEALQFIAKKFPNSRLYLGGHSAGAHLVAMMMTIHDWANPKFLDRIKGVCLMAGIYDLQPLLPIRVLHDRNITRTIAIRNSPDVILRTHPPSFRCPVKLIIGEHEPPSFHKQTRDFMQVLDSQHVSTCFHELSGMDHFSAVSAYADQTSLVFKEIQRMILEK